MWKLSNRIGRNIALIYLRNNLPQFADQYQDTKLFGKALQVAGITIICLHAIRIEYSDSVVNGRIKKTYYISNHYLNCRCFPVEASIKRTQLSRSQ